MYYIKETWATKMKGFVDDDINFDSGILYLNPFEFIYKSHHSVEQYQKSTDSITSSVYSFPTSDEIKLFKTYEKLSKL